MTDTTITDAVCFPQDDGTGVTDGSEDYNSAAFFSLLAKYKGEGSYVGEDTTGAPTLQFANVDTTNEQVDVLAGYAYIMEGGKTVQSGSQTTYDTTLPDDVPYVVALPTDVVDLGLGTDTGNDLWLAVDPTANDSVYIRHGSGLTAPTDPSVKLGTVDTSNGSTTRPNDMPTSSGIQTGGGGTDSYTIHDAANGKDLGVFNEGGNVEFPSGPIIAPDNGVFWESGYGSVVTGYNNLEYKGFNEITYRAKGRLHNGIDWKYEIASDLNWSSKWDSNFVYFQKQGGSPDILRIYEQGFVGIGPIVEGIQSGINPGHTITEKSSPKSFNFNSSEKRDIHDQTDVTISNSSGADATEDITVELYDGSDTTGTLVVSETKSVTVLDTNTKTVTFLSTEQSLDTGTYHIEVTQSGTSLTVDQTDEHTKGATWTFDQTATGGWELTTQDNDKVFSADPIEGAFTNLQVGDGARIENATDAQNAREFKSHTNIADTGTTQLLSVATETGKVLVVDRTNGSSAEFIIDGVNGAVDAKVTDPDAAFSTTAGNAGTTNVYYDGTNALFELENQTGASADYSVHLLA